MEQLTGASIGVFIALTVCVIGGAAALTGRALASNWRPAWQAVLASLGLGLFDRFLVYALFDGPLFSLKGLLFDTAVIMLIMLVTFRLARVAKLAEQYPWVYERRSIWRLRRKETGGGQA